MEGNNIKMSQSELQQEQQDNAARLVMKTFYRVAKDEGATPSEVVQYLQSKFGDVWKLDVLNGIAKETLKKSEALGFVDRLGDRYVSKLARNRACCSGRRRRRSSRRRQCCSKRRHLYCARGRRRCC